MRLPLAALLLLALPAGAVEVPPEGQCPPYPLPRSQPAPDPEDVVPPLFQPGEKIPMKGLARLSRYLPEEIWERRDVFFYEGMELEVGPCHRRYPAPPFFGAASRANAGVVRLDERNNLLDYRGSGLPFPWQEISDDDPQAGAKWAWNYRYRYLGSGARGDFRILLVARRGRKIERFLGDFYLLPMRGLPGASSDGNGASYWAGGRFTSPPVARGVAWRQLHPTGADGDPDRSDELWIYAPETRRVRRAPPTAVDGLYMPSYTRGNQGDLSQITLPDGVSTPSSSIAAAEHTRMGFTGMFLRPNQYRWTLLRVQDVLAPLNGITPGYPLDDSRSYGSSGQSLASDRWDVRRTVVVRGEKPERDGQIQSVTLWIDALTQQLLYMVTRRSNGGLFEVGSFAGRFSGDDPSHPQWAGSGLEFGVILPTAASFYTGRGTGWLRESFELRSDPPEAEETRDFTSTTKLQRGR